MDDNLITGIVAAVTGIGSFIVGQFKARREIDNIAITNVQKSVDVYRIVIDDLKGQIKELLQKVEDLEGKIDELKQENCELKDMVQKRNNRLKELEEKQ